MNYKTFIYLLIGYAKSQDLDLEYEAPQYIKEAEDRLLEITSELK